MGHIFSVIGQKKNAIMTHCDCNKTVGLLNMSDCLIECLDLFE